MFHIDKTPRIPEASSNRDNPIHREVHKIGPERIYNEEEISQTRVEILNKYGISPDHVIVDLPAGSGEQRVIRAFSIIKNLSDNKQIYYAEGHKSHFELFQEIIDKFRQDIAITALDQLDLDKWVIKKGFLDPNHNHFQSFPHARAGLINIYQDNIRINGREPLAETDNLPNWFLSADSEDQSRMGRLSSDPLG